MIFSWKDVVSVVVPAFLYIVLVILSVAVSWRAVFSMFEAVALRRAARVRLKASKAGGKRGRKRSISSDFDMLLRFNFGVLYPISRQILFALMLFIASGVFFVFTGFSFIQRALFGVIASLIPVGVLYLRRNLARVNSSHEGIDLISEMLNQYKIKDGDIYDALEATVIHVRGAKTIKRSLFVLASALRESSSEEDTNRALDLFVSGVATEWARLLANNIFIAVEEKGDISIGLTDILEELRRTKLVFERSNRLNVESFALSLLMMPLLYIGSIVMYTRFQGSSVSDFFKVQFGDRNSILLFILICAMYVGGIFVYIMFRKRKFDFS